MPHPGPGSSPRAGPSPPTCAGSCSLCAYQGLTHTRFLLSTQVEKTAPPQASGLASLLQREGPGTQHTAAPKPEPFLLPGRSSSLVTVLSRRSRK